jgi:anti-sigma factor RsiW
MNDSEFDTMLRAAGSAPPVPEDFQRAVWRRIEAREGEAAAMPRIRRAFSPWAAVAALAATIILGAWLGLHARPDGDQAKAEYVRSISPFARH